MQVDEQIESTPRDLIRRFHACSNYPRQDEAACLFLAQDLSKASRMTGETCTAIVERCTEASTFCPTGADFLIIGRELRDDRKRATTPDPVAELRKKYGAPQSFPLVYDHERAKQRHAERDELWRAAKGLGLYADAKWPSEAVMCEALRKAGYPKTAYQAEVMKAWERI